MPLKPGDLVQPSNQEHNAHYYKGQVWRVESIVGDLAKCRMLGESYHHFFSVQCLVKVEEKRQ